MNFTQGDLEEVQKRLQKQDIDSTAPLPAIDEAERLKELNEQLQNGELLVMMANEENRYKGGQSLESMLVPAIKVKYHDPDMPRITRLPQGDWIDLVNVEDITLFPGEFGMFSLGVSIELPPGYEAQVVPRSSTYKKWGVLQVNTPAIIDNSFSGNDDVWHWLIFAPKSYVHIPKYTRVCQFRLVENQPHFPIIEVEELTNETRGMVGSTGE